MEDKPNNKSDALRKYGRYSSVVFQMLFIIGISFWGGNKLNNYLTNRTKILTVIIGFSGLCLSLYTTLKRLEILNKQEDQENDTPE